MSIKLKARKNRENYGIKTCFFENINLVDKNLVGLTKRKRRKTQNFQDQK